MSILGLNKSLKEYTFTVVDTETTGLSPYKGAELLEISAVKINSDFNLDLNNHFTTLIKPEKPIPSKTIEINGIDEKMVENAPLIDEVLPKFAEFAENTVFIAHNAKFDFTFINYYMKKHCVDCKLVCILDTVSITKKFYPNIGRYNLDSLIRYFDINVEIENSYRHRALFDAVNTSVVFLKAIEKMKFLGLDLTLSNLL
ncbi:3'-5' exonuclease [Deferribacterales bacterium Es71-Z0220]|uniref:3'-5' exonuclease n=1 Tax=Deferrivibrio essentukiensis TaxID=2880922 RepID=UPI001F6219DA|nr:3'-5' exonuclease [Deferrivibrio essentukiensis]MCB4203611.1 3'-5' exonuclease [Deferrivibrio essentukiensis]